MHVMKSPNWRFELPFATSSIQSTVFLNDLLELNAIRLLGSLPHYSTINTLLWLNNLQLLDKIKVCLPRRYF